jgi:hypothetical protein
MKVNFQPYQLIRAAQFFGLSCLLQGLASHDDEGRANEVIDRDEACCCA